MRTFVVALATLAMSATAVRAADDSPVVGKFPDTKKSCHVYLFTLKKNNISLSMSAQEFCTKMDYGEAVLFSRPEEVGDDHKAVPGKLDWVICQFAEKGKECP
jgi:hypothetical protein